jgi:hypothetical protein
MPFKNSISGGAKVWRTGRRTMGFLFKVLFLEVCSLTACLWILPCIVFRMLVWGLLLEYIFVYQAVQLLRDPSNAPLRASCCDPQVGIDLVWGLPILCLGVLRLEMMSGSVFFGASCMRLMLCRIAMALAVYYLTKVNRVTWSFSKTCCFNKSIKLQCCF